VHSGEVLASVSLPTFNPNLDINPLEEKMYNKSVSSVYNLGSVFKIFTVTSGLENGVRASDTFRVSDGFPVSKGFVIKDEHGRHEYLSVPEIFAYSSNVGIAQIINRIGTMTHRHFLEKIGLFEPIDIELPRAEIGKPLSSKDWDASVYYTVGYGYGLLISPLHFAKIATEIINDGKRMELTLLRKSKQDIQNSNAAKMTIVSAETSKIMKEIMREAVDSGTARRATVNGYTVCGKTGTSQKYDQHIKGWNPSRKFVSFFGFFPCYNPRYTIYVGIDEPKQTSESGILQGGTVAAPIVANIIEQIGPMLNVKPDLIKSEKK
jgi:cell division protein FtsI (penicillin-binding protein 3)